MLTKGPFIDSGPDLVRRELDPALVRPEVGHIDGVGRASVGFDAKGIAAGWGKDHDLAKVAVAPNPKDPFLGIVDFPAQMQ